MNNIKNTMEALVTSVLSGIASMVKGNSNDTRQEIIDRNINVSLLYLSNIKKVILERINKEAGLKGEQHEIISRILNEEL